MSAGRAIGRVGLPGSAGAVWLLLVVVVLLLVPVLVLLGCGGVDEGGEIEAEGGTALAPRDTQLDCRAQLSPILSGYGSPGAHTVEVLEVANPAFPAQPVTLHRPLGVATPPLIVFGHGNGLSDPSAYAKLLHHIVSRGYAVIYASHQVEPGRHEDRYRALWTGLSAAIKAHGAQLDLTRVGFVGHSYGAGALPRVAHRALVDEGWGTRGALMLLMAPWYALEMTENGWAELPNHLEVMTLSFEADDVTDHRIAIAIHHSFTAERNTYLVVRSDARPGCELHADHAVPQSGGLGGRDDPLDEYAVFKRFDALAASAFDRDPAGTHVAHGRGNRDQLAMGVWSDGSPVTPLDFRVDPQPAQPSSFYVFQAADREAWEAYPEPSE